MRPQPIIIIHPCGCLLKEHLLIGYLQKEGHIKFFVIGAMASLHPSIVLFTTWRNPAQARSEGLKIKPVQLGESLRIIPSPFPSPIRLHSYFSLDALLPHPSDYGGEEQESIGQVHLVAISQEAEAGFSLQAGPLVARQVAMAEMVPASLTQGVFIQDVFHICLKKGEGFLLFPGPEGGIEAPAGLTLTCKPVAAQDVANRLGRKVNPAPVQIPGKPPAAIACFSACLKHFFFYPGRGLSGGVMGFSGAVLKPSLSFLPIPSHPLTDGVAGGLPQPGSLAYAKGSLPGLY